MKGSDPASEIVCDAILAESENHEMVAHVVLEPPQEIVTEAVELSDSFEDLEEHLLDRCSFKITWKLSD